ncbi:MAG: hypothetical protein HKN79_03530 [Flavobacteriales bacterium]|nr:hypothetical protein [Flavobacteriales bacterium]
MKNLVFLIILSLAFTQRPFAQNAIGQWVDQLSYQSVDQIIDDGEQLYCLTGKGLFTYEKSSGLLTRMSKSTGLSDVDIVSAAYADQVGVLVLGYANGNIDLVTSNGITNLGDIKRSSVIGDKGIYRIIAEGDEAWLATGFGIVVIDLVAVEVKDTYFIAPGGGSVTVYDLILDPDLVWAATDGGILTADRASNLADFFNWNLISDIPSATEPFDQIERYGDWVLTHSLGTPEVIYANDGSGWIPVPGTEGVQTQDIVRSGDQVIFAYRNFLQVRNSQLNNDLTVNQYPFDEGVRSLTGRSDGQGGYWIGDENYGLVRYSSADEVNSVFPDGPRYDDSWQLHAFDGRLYMAHGELQTNFDNQFSNKGFSGREGAQWITYDDQLIDGSVRDLVDVRIDPFDPDLKYFAAFFGGVLQYDSSSDEYVLFSEEQNNANLEPSTLNPDRIQVGNLAFDISGNLWATNNYTAEPFKVRTRDGEWKAFGCPGVISGNTLLGEMVVTESGQTWTVLPRGVGLLLLQHGNDLEDTDSHQCKTFGTGVGDGALPTTTIFSIAEDRDGEIWLGTAEGPVVNYNPLSIFTSNPADFQSILVERDGNVERLLGSESITSIEVDGANRKWIGTLTGGVFLLSSDGTEELLHFTTSNSPLFSDVIKDIEVDPVTGAVHIATDKGTVTYFGDATQGGLENECFDVYPNPVRPGYEGVITLDGLVRDSEVKFTDLAGNIVFQSISNGGRVTWNGRDFSGNKVATGVYFALVSDSEGESSCVTKLLFIR